MHPRELVYNAAGNAAIITAVNSLGMGAGASSVGSGTLTFSAASTGTFDYTVNGITQTKNITKQVFGTPATVCR